MTKCYAYFIAIALMGGYLWPAGTANAQAPNTHQDYGHWHKYPKQPKVWYCCYYCKKPPQPRPVCHLYCCYYMTWYENDPKYCYLYDPGKKSYVGRWDYTNPKKWQYSPVSKHQPGAKPRDLQYQPAGAPPNYPGGNAPMDPPPNLPPV